MGLYVTSFTTLIHFLDKVQCAEGYHFVVTLHVAVIVADSIVNNLKANQLDKKIIHNFQAMEKITISLSNNYYTLCYWS